MNTSIDKTSNAAPASSAIVGDIGGTNARLALADISQEKPVVSHIHDYPSGDYAKAGDVFRAYRNETQYTATIAVIAAAGPIDKGQVHFTNLGWSLSEDDLREMGFARACLLNDFEALALSTNHLGPNDARPLGPDEQGAPDATVAVIGPGTGFGASAMVRGRGRSVAMAAEGGHASFAPGDAAEREIQRVLEGRFGHVSIERVLSGPGLQNLHEALNAIEGTGLAARDSSEITSRALAGEASSTRTVMRFCAILGSVAGDFALTYGARGGLFVAGGIAPAIFSLLEKSDFRRRFESKGRFESYLRPIPTRVIVHPHAAFLGAAAVARELAASM